MSVLGSESNIKVKKLVGEDGMTSLKGCVVGYDPRQKHWRKVTFLFGDRVDGR